MKCARYAFLLVPLLLAGCNPPPPPPPPQAPPSLGVDLVATDIAWPVPLVVGQRVPFSITVQNVGDTATPSSTIVDVLVSVDGVDVGWSDNLTVDLAPGASRVQVVNGGPDGSDGLWAVTGGSHNVQAYVNSGSLPARPPVPESNPNNNTLVKPFVVVRPIVFLSDRTGNDEVWSRHPDGSNEIQLTYSPEREVEPRLSPDGTQILFGRQRDPRAPQARLWLMNADGTNQHDVSPPPLPTSNPGPPSVSWDRNGIWSPDGTQIAFIRSGNPSGMLIMNADGSNARAEIPISEALVDRYTNLVWSPDGTRFAYVYLYVCCLQHIQIHPLDGSPGHALIGPLSMADTETYSIGPVWSADSKQITFFGRLSRGGPAGRWIANAEGPPNPVPAP